MSSPTVAPKKAEKDAKEWIAALLGAKPTAKPVDPLEGLDIDEIRGNMTFTVEKIPHGAVEHLKSLVGKNTVTSLNKKGDAMKELDTDEDNPSLKGVDKETLKKAGVALKKIVAIKDKVLKEKFAEAGYSGEKLARMEEALEAYEKTQRLPEGGPSKEEIEEFAKLTGKIESEVADEVFTPLVRQGAIPENMVPDRFSAMKRTFEGAKKSYEERLQKYTEESGKNGDLIRKLGVSQELIDKSAKLGQAILSALPSGAGGEVVAGVSLAAELLPLASGLAIGTTEQIIQRKDPQDIVDAVLTGVGGMCATALSGTNVDADIGPIITGSICAVIAGGRIARSIKDKDPDAALGALAAAASAALTTAGTATGNDNMKDWGPVVISAILTGAKAKAYRDAVKNGDEKEIKKALAELLEDGIGTISKAVGSGIDDLDSNSDQAEDLGDIVDKAADTASDFEKEALEDDEQEEGISKEDKERLQALKKTIQEQEVIIQDKSAGRDEKRAACKKKAEAMLELQENRQMLKKLAEADEPDFLDITQEDLDDSDDDITPPHKLQELILKLQKDQKIFKLINTLSGLPLQVAADFFPPVGAAINFKQFAFESMIAVKHARALLEWQTNAKNAKLGASPQVHAMLSRVGMSERRATEHSINAALYLTAGVGHIVATVGGHGAPVGVAITAGAKVGLAAAALAKVAIDEAEMAHGWKLFQKALKNPANRKAARRAIEENPTLAKYSLAWGAISGGDVFAKSALKKCGLTPQVLATEGANVSEVQRFLETMFDEDLVILRAVPDKKDWYPSKKPALTFVSWTAFLGAATTKAKPALLKGSGGAVSEAFVAFNTAEQKVKDATKEFDQANEKMNKMVTEAIANIPKPEPGKKAVAPQKPDEIQKEAIEKSKIEEAKQNLEDSKKELKEAIQGVQAAATSFVPVNETDKKPHEQMREYLDALIALGDLKLRELGGVTVALEMEEEQEEEAESVAA
jgi:hypothetical protein